MEQAGDLKLTRAKLEEDAKRMAILKDKEREHRIEELVKKYRKYLDAVDGTIFEMRGVHLLRPQLSYIALCVERTWHINRDKPKEELLTLMSVAGIQAVCDMLCMSTPNEIEIEDYKVAME